MAPNTTNVNLESEMNVGQRGTFTDGQQGVITQLFANVAGKAGAYAEFSSDTGARFIIAANEFTPAPYVYYERTEKNPLLARGAVATGRRFITPCCTASVDEFRLPDGTLWTIGSVAGHGFGEPSPGSLDKMNETGTRVEADGTERRVRYDAARDAEVA